MGKTCNRFLNHLAQVDSAGYVIPCCQFTREWLEKWEPFNLRNLDTFDNILTSDRWNTLQEEMLNEDIPECRNCWRQEKTGAHSMRQWANQTEVENPGKLESLEIGIDTTCNMMCRICRPGQSSKWYSADSILTKLHEYQNKNGFQYDKSLVDTSNSTKLINALNNTNLTKLKTVRINGGEPFYSKKLLTLLQKIDKDAKIENVELSFNTNGSIFPTGEIADLLHRAKKLRIDFSIDAVGDLATVTRWGVEWGIIEETIDKWKSNYKNATFGMHSVISLLNINRIKDLYDFSESKNLQWSYYALSSPEHLSIDQLPVESRKAYLVKFDDKSLTQEIEINDILINTPYTKKTEYDFFLEATRLLDNYQGNSFKNVNPEIYNLIEELLKHQCR